MKTVNIDYGRAGMDDSRFCEMETDHSILCLRERISSDVDNVNNKWARREENSRL